MKAIRGWIPTAILTVTILIGATGANAGIITAGYAPTPTNNPTSPCQTNSNTGIITAGFTGIITAGFTGIITAGFTGIITAGYNSGIIVTDRKSETPSTTTSCGIIVTD